MRFNPKDIDTTTILSEKQLKKEGWAIDDGGKNMLHPQYGEKAPWISERNKKLVCEKNYNLDRHRPCRNRFKRISPLKASTLPIVRRCLREVFEVSNRKIPKWQDGRIKNIIEENK